MKSQHLTGLFLLGILLVLLQNPATAQENKVNPNGYNVFYYGNGQISSEGYMRNGKPDGYWKTYYVNGQLKSEGNRAQFMLDSVWVFYNEQGDTTEKINYLYGEKNGYQYTYTTTNNKQNPNPIVAKELFVQGLQQGISEYYRPNGRLKRTARFRNGKKHGYEKYYNTDQRLTEMREYHNGYPIEQWTINRYNNQGQKQGTWMTFHENGEIARIEEYQNGQLNGLVRIYDKNGNLLETNQFVGGKPLSEQTANAAPEEQPTEVKEQFFETGQLKQRGAYLEDNTPVGLHQKFDKQGNILVSKFYDYNGQLTGQGVVDKKGLKQGDWMWFYPDSILKSKGRYVDDKRTGPWIFYFKNGNIEQEGQYRKGRLQGQWKWYTRQGNLLKTEEYTNGQPDGEFREYNRQGQVIVEGAYLQGDKEGFWTYHVGDQREEGEYRLGRKSGLWKHYYPNDKLKFEGEYLQGKAHGQHLHYYKNGVVRLEAFYDNGQKTKTWRSFDREGNLLMTVTYENDKEVRIDGWRVDEP